MSPSSWLPKSQSAADPGHRSQADPLHQISVPELPEVETVANGVHSRVAGQRIVGVWTSGKSLTFKSPEDEIAATLTGATIDRVHRVGKTVVINLTRTPTSGKPSNPTQTASAATIPSAKGAPYTSLGRRGVQRAFFARGCKAPGNGPREKGAESPTYSSPEAPPAQFLVHLGMTGRLLVSHPELPLPPHTHAVLTLADGRELRFVDPRRFGRLSVLHPDSDQPQGYTGPGAEPTTISPDEFSRLFRGRKLAIKAALLNQSILHGVGNIYADESLFRAGIRPRRHAGRLTRPELNRLHAALQTVLAKAIQLGGSSVSDYVDADGVRGFFQFEHKVYGRAGQNCTACATPLKKIIVGGRTTVYCPTCQR